MTIGEDHQASWLSFPTTLTGGTKTSMRFDSVVVDRDYQNLPLVVFGEWEDEVARSPISFEPLCQIIPPESRLLVVDSD
jgi:hypothetical protein